MLTCWKNKQLSIKFIKGIKIIPVSDAFAILEHTLTKSIIPLNLSESQLKNNQNTTSTH